MRRPLTGLTLARRALFKQQRLYMKVCRIASFAIRHSTLPAHKETPYIMTVKHYSAIPPAPVTRGVNA